jgi:hypothetical protein
MSKQKQRRAREKAQDLQMNTHPDRVRTIREWAKLNSISEDTARRIIGRREIAVVELSAKRLGIRDRDNRRWQKSRLRAAS